MSTYSLMTMPMVFALAISTGAQENESPRLPRFEDYPVVEIWHGEPAPLKLTSRSERLYRTRLTNEECISGAIIDLQSGNVYSPPSTGDTAHFSVCQSAYEDSGVDFHLDSRLMILRCGLNYSQRLGKNVPNAYYLIWDSNSFKEVHDIGSRKVRRRYSTGSPK